MRVYYYYYYCTVIANSRTVSAREAYPDDSDVHRRVKSRRLCACLYLDLRGQFPAQITCGGTFVSGEESNLAALSGRRRGSVDRTAPDDRPPARLCVDDTTTTEGIINRFAPCVRVVADSGSVRGRLSSRLVVRRN